MSVPVEIERKYIIAMPSLAILAEQPQYSKSEILQIYLQAPEGVTHRVRRREYAWGAVCTETVKRRIDALSAFEEEREISAERFCELAASIAAGSRPLRKVRHVFSYLGKTMEIDVYPEWRGCAVLETELASREERVALPPFIEVLREVTGERAFSNAALSYSFPSEESLFNSEKRNAEKA